jgi:hypothetical protein
VTLIPATAPDFFTEDTPTAVLVRQVVRSRNSTKPQHTVAKLKAARDRKIAGGEKCGGRKSYAERDSTLIALAPSYTVPIRIAGRSRCARSRLLSLSTVM